MIGSVEGGTSSFLVSVWGSGSDLGFNLGFGLGLGWGSESDSGSGLGFNLGLSSERGGLLELDLLLSFT